MATDRPSDDRGRAHVGGWYSRGGFLSRPQPEIRLLKEFIQGSVREYIAKAGDNSTAERTRLDIHSWVALTQPNDYQSPHVHPKSQISAVYYVNVPDTPPPQGNLVFVTPLCEQEMSFVPSLSPSSMSVKPQGGMLVLFPSYLRHYTHPFYSGEDRSLVVATINVG